MIISSDLPNLPARPTSRSLRPMPDAADLPSRNAALQRRAMQAALANAVRAMRSRERFTASSHRTHGRPLK